MEEAISRQAFRYGEQVRLLEDAEMMEDRRRIRKAWRDFLTQLEFADDYLWRIALTSYRNAYAQ